MNLPFRFKSTFATYNLWNRLESVPEICDAIENDIDSRITEIDERAEIAQKEDDDEYKDHLLDQLGDMHYSYSNEWTLLIRESFFLTLCSSFEYHLIALCDNYAAHIGTPLRTKNLRDNGITQCETLLKLLGLPDSTFADWQPVKDIYKIRNKIAHAGAKHGEGTHNLSKLYPKILEETTDEKGEIKIKAGGISTLAEIMTKALRTITSHLHQEETH